jgi:flagellar hook-associated protein 1 FlgK
MGSAFSGLSVATRGLYVSQTALNTIGHNVTNVDTDGYVRQQAIQVDTAYLKSGRYQIGTGVGIEETRQIRSIFLDNMYRDEQSSLKYWQNKQSTVEDIESVMNDLSDEDTLQDAINSFFNSWETVSEDPSSGSARASLLEYANSMVEMFNQFDNQLDQMQDNLDSQVKSMVKDINSISKQVADLNGKIAASELNGDNANDYRDQLNSLLDTLSEYVGINVSQDSAGMYNVSVGGVGLVAGKNFYTMECKTNSSNGAFYTVVWSGTDEKAGLNDGMLLGLIESRGDVNGDKGSTENGSMVESDDVDADADSNSYKFTGDSENLIPELRKGLNILVNLLARKINSIHSSGEGLDGSTGVDFFIKIDDSLPFEIGNIKVNPELSDTDKIAASSIGSSNDGEVAAQISDFSDTEYFNNDGLKMTISDFYSMLVDWIGTKGDEAKSFAENQGTLVQQVESEKDSLSSVSLDEELTNLVKYQHAYNSSAKLMNTIDGMLETIIQNMGIVGR